MVFFTKSLNILLQKEKDLDTIDDAIGHFKHMLEIR